MLGSISSWIRPNLASRRLLPKTPCRKHSTVGRLPMRSLAIHSARRAKFFAWVFLRNVRIARGQQRSSTIPLSPWDLDETLRRTKNTYSSPKIGRCGRWLRLGAGLLPCLKSTLYAAPILLLQRKSVTAQREFQMRLPFPRV